MLQMTDTVEVVETTKETAAMRKTRDWLDRQIERSKKGEFTDIYTLTPELAKCLLERNPINRPINKANSAELAQDITAGRFLFNGESVIVSNTGILCDGQHRCSIVVATGVAVRTVIVFGVAEEARYTIDTGRSKSVSNFLAMKGKPYSQVLGTVAGYLLDYRNRGKLHWGGPGRPSKATILKAVDETRGLEASCEFTYPAMKTTRSHAVLAFCHFVIARRASRHLADEYISAVVYGEHIGKGHPAYYVRNRLINMQRGVTANEKAELIFRGWNAFRLGSKMTACRLSNDQLPKLEG